MRLKVRRYLQRNLIAFDQLWNAVWGGDPKETMSDSLWRHVTEGNRGACVLCRVLDLFERDHCRKSHERNLQRMREALACEPMSDQADAPIDPPAP